ncbi:MAG: hypothetical protein VXW32_15075 [Myxococcota bacterium]|nr:hypothetical protein [Myxococcota bacterium]
MIAFLFIAALASTAQAAPPLASEPPRSSWFTYTGFPWTGVHYSPAAQRNAQWTVHAETALFRRWDASAGIRFFWRPKQNLEVQASFSAGWIVQRGPLARHGPQANATARLQHLGKVVPRIEHKSAVFWAQSSTEPDYQELSETVGLFTPLRTHFWEMGLGFPMNNKLLIEPSLRFGSVDEQFAIPAVSLGLRSLP